MRIRLAGSDDASAIWAILEPMIRGGGVYTLPRNMTQEEALEYWAGCDRETFVAEEEGRILGTYFFKAEQLGDSQVVQCAYATAIDASECNVGRRMCEHSLEVARVKGYKSMRFSIEMSTSKPIVRAWQAHSVEFPGN
jgi:hypothetical protein